MKDKIDWHAVKVLTRKEIQQLMHHTQVIATLVAAPIVFFVLFPLLGPILAALGLAQIPLVEGMRLTSSIMLPMFFYMPAVLANALATDSFAGEKERKTIETTFTLPCSTATLVVAKLIVIMIPQFLFILGGFIIVGAISNVILLSYKTIIIFNEWIWYLVVFLVAPVFVTMFTLLGILTSIKTRSLKGAQSISSIPMIPLFFLFFSFFPTPVTSIPSILFALTGIGIIGCLSLLVACIRSIDREKFILQLD